MSQSTTGAQKSTHIKKMTPFYNFVSRTIWDKSKLMQPPTYSSPTSSKGNSTSRDLQYHKNSTSRDLEYHENSTSRDLQYHENSTSRDLQYQFP